MSMAQTRDMALLVDDNPETTHMIVEALEANGISVLAALDGDRALELAARARPDIILMDADMPGKDGFETAQALKDRADTENIPVIFITGMTGTDAVIRGLQSGAVDYLTKPVSPDELIARIGVHLANARAVATAREALELCEKSLLALDQDVKLIWTTGHALKLLQAAGWQGKATKPDQSQSLCLPQYMQARLTSLVQAWPNLADPVIIEGDGQTPDFVFVGRTGAGEYLFRLVQAQSLEDGPFLEAQFGLTPREAEALVWVSRGKPNQDISDILQCSPRTINKHLERVFDKLGVDNRTAAAIMAVHSLTGRR